MKNLEFERDPNGLWYVVLPEWQGPRADLLMVQGADTMLDRLAGENNIVHLTATEIETADTEFTLHFVREESEGGWYDLRSDTFNLDVWLCKVVKFVYDGELPQIIYCHLQKNS